MLRRETMAVCCGNVRRCRAEDDLWTDSYDFRERLEVSRFLKRERKTWKAGKKLVGFLELLARSRSFIPSPSRLM